VTRLGEFSLTRRSLTLGRFSKITEVDEIFADTFLPTWIKLCVY
jgi:hypothetical protein